jgi:hypothetical protein
MDCSCRSRSVCYQFTIDLPASSGRISVLMRACWLMCRPLIMIAGLIGQLVAVPPILGQESRPPSGGREPPAQEQRVRLDAVPGQLNVVRQSDEGVALVAAAVPNGLQITDPQLDVVEPRGIKATIVPVPTKTAGSGDIAWAVKISADSLASSDVQIPVRFTYTAGTEKLPRQALTSIRAIVLPTPESALTIRLERGFEILTEWGAHDLTLFIENRASEDVIIRQVSEISGPNFLAFDFESAKDKTVPADSTIAVPGSVSFIKDRRPSPRSHTITIRALISGTRTPGQFEKLVDTKIDVGIAGVGDTLKAFELPSLFLLPGLLTLVVASWLNSRLFSWRTTNQPPTWDAKQPSFWVAAVTASGVIAWIVFVVFQYDILESYNLNDVILLWLLSITVFPAIYLTVYFAGGYPLDRLSAKLHRFSERNNPSTDDPPDEFLRKLALKGSSFYMNSFEIPRFGGLSRVFLPNLVANGGKFWAIPGAVITVGPTEPEMAHELDEVLDSSDGVKKLHTLLKRASAPSHQSAWERFAQIFVRQQQENVRIEWENSIIKGPCELDDSEKDNAKNFSAPRSFLRRGRINR